MVRMFILVKRKGTKRFSGAIPVKKGVSKKQLTILLRKQLKKGLTAKIVNETTLKSVINRQSPRSKAKNKKLKRRR